MTAWLGLVPRRYSSEGKQLLLGISKHGDRYLCSLLIHGAQSVIKQLNKETTATSNQWLLDWIVVKK